LIISFYFINDFIFRKIATKLRLQALFYFRREKQILIKKKLNTIMCVAIIDLTSENISLKTAVTVNS